MAPQLGWLVLCCALAMLVGGFSFAAEPAPLCFDLVDNAEPASDVPTIEPWITVELDPDYGGLWVVAGDLDGDGEVEIVSAENHNEGDVHYTSTAVAQKLDGTVLWRWGKPGIGRKNWHHDVACQIHDWDGDGRNEVVVCAEDAIVELDGATGQEKRRIPIPKDATDCLVFCNLSGGARASDVLVKDRYHRIWAYNQAGELLWNVNNPGKYLTAHQPRPMDVDGDGRDELMAGYALLNADGSVRWVFESKAVDLKRGHLDCARVVKRGAKPEDWRIALTCCGANNLAVVDGAGKTIWERSGQHFESITIGDIVPGRPGPHLLVDIDHRPEGEGPLWVFDADGELLGRIMTPYARHHRLADWDGDGKDEILNASNRAIYKGDGTRIATLATPGASKGGYEASLLIGDMTGNGVPDALFATPERVYVYRNEKGRRPQAPIPLGTGVNVTLY